MQNWKPCSAWRGPLWAVLLAVCAVTSAVPAVAAPKGKVIDVLVASANRAFEEGNFVRAGELFLEVYRQDKTNPVALNNAARAFMFGEKLERAAELLRELLGLPNLPAELRATAQERLVEVQERQAQAAADSAAEAEKSGKFGTAASLWAEAARLNPKKLLWKLREARALHLAGEANRAIAVYEAFLAVAPKELAERAQAEAWRAELVSARGAAKEAGKAEKVAAPVEAAPAPVAAPAKEAAPAPPPVVVAKEVAGEAKAAAPAPPPALAEEATRASKPPKAEAGAVGTGPADKDRTPRSAERAVTPPTTETSKASAVGEETRGGAPSLLGPPSEPASLSGLITRLEAAHTWQSFLGNHLSYGGAVGVRIWNVALHIHGAAIKGGGWKVGSSIYYSWPFVRLGLGVDYGVRPKRMPDVRDGYHERDSDGNYSYKDVDFNATVAYAGVDCKPTWRWWPSFVSVFARVGQVIASGPDVTSGLSIGRLRW
ncbi:MAG: tetratricopeptide repeat protein [Deltaproteobacteria bacterium]|nr:tetratricopeptide repeat protein [Deltaproteobacteria bacterium]